MVKIWLYLFILNGPTPASFYLFSSFQTHITIFTTIKCEKMSWPSSIQHWDLNPQPLDSKSPPITTRPGLPPRLHLLICDVL